MERDEQDYFCCLRQKLWIATVGSLWTLGFLLSMLFDKSILFTVTAIVLVPMLFLAVLSDNWLVRSINYYTQVLVLACLAIVTISTCVVIYIDQTYRGLIITLCEADQADGENATFQASGECTLFLERYLCAAVCLIATSLIGV